MGQPFAPQRISRSRAARSHGNLDPIRFGGTGLSGSRLRVKRTLGHNQSYARLHPHADLPRRPRRARGASLRRARIGRALPDHRRPHAAALLHLAARRGAPRRARARPATAEPSDLRSLDGEPVVTVTRRRPRRRAAAAPHSSKQRGVACLEADVRFAYRYLIDRGIRGAFEVDGRHATAAAPRPRLPQSRAAAGALGAAAEGPVDRHRNQPATGDQLYAIALHTRDFERVIIVHHGALEHAEPVPSEKAAIRRFLELPRHASIRTSSPAGTSSTSTSRCCRASRAATASTSPSAATTTSSTCARTPRSRASRAPSSSAAWCSTGCR